VYERLKVSSSDDGKVVHLEFDHGKANEMGTAELAELERLTAQLRAGSATALVTHSKKRSSKGTPLFVAGANVTERVGWTDDRVKAHVRWQRQVLSGLAAAPVFHVCVVDGIALGWGTEYTLTADYVVACDGPEGACRRSARCGAASAARSICWSSAGASRARASPATPRCAGCAWRWWRRGDFAYGTSSRSSKLVHGGPALPGAAYELGLVFEAVSERRILMDIAPHLVHPQGFLFPVFKESRQPMWMINAGCGCTTA
jgi:hypothetical protein